MIFLEDTIDYIIPCNNSLLRLRVIMPSRPCMIWLLSLHLPFSLHLFPTHSRYIIPHSLLDPEAFYAFSCFGKFAEASHFFLE